MRRMNTGEAEEVVVGGVHPGWCDVTSGAAAALLLTVATVACAPKPPVECGGKIYPESASAEALSIVERAAAESRPFCAGASDGCDFSVARTSQGWSVAVTRMIVVEGKCVSRLGDERFYSYDKSGAPVGVIDGI